MQSPSSATGTICELLALPGFHWEPALLLTNSSYVATMDIPTTHL